MSLSLALVLAGLMGAGGVVLAAAGAHGAPGAGLESGAYLLLLHAVAVMASVALIDGNRLWRALATVAVAGWVAGAVLFAGDIALRALAGYRLFPMAAPSGGVLMIVSWAAFTVSAMLGRR